MSDQKKLPIPLTQAPYAKKDSWIIWLENEKCQIYDFEIYETFPKKYPGRVSSYIEQYVKRYNDIGNCMSDWDQWTLQDIFFKFGFQQEYVDRETQLMVLDKLAKIKEFKSSIEEYKKYFNAAHLY